MSSGCAWPWSRSSVAVQAPEDIPGSLHAPPLGSGPPPVWHDLMHLCGCHLFSCPLHPPTPAAYTPMLSGTLLLSSGKLSTTFNFSKHPFSLTVLLKPDHHLRLLGFSTAFQLLFFLNLSHISIRQCLEMVWMSFISFIIIHIHLVLQSPTP